jgi:hypothetical protein
LNPAIKEALIVISCLIEFNSDLIRVKLALFISDYPAFSAVEDNLRLQALNVISEDI